jgi:hypothetical protein
MDKLSKLTKEIKQYQDWVDPAKVNGIFAACLIATRNYEKARVIQAEIDKLKPKKQYSPYMWFKK